MRIEWFHYFLTTSALGMKFPRVNTFVDTFRGKCRLLKYHVRVIKTEETSIVKLCQLLLQISGLTHHRPVTSELLLSQELKHAFSGKF